MRADGVIGVAAWSLRFRYWAWRVAVDDPLPTPDVQVFALYHAGDGTRAVPDFTTPTSPLSVLMRTRALALAS
mgnify:CR=1 FL=1